MAESTVHKPLTPHIANDVSSELAEKIISKFQHISRTQKLLPKGEKIVGIIKAKSVNSSQIVITDYRIFTAKANGSFSNIVFNNEIVEKDIQSVTVRAIKSVFNQISYVLDIERNGSISKYATIKSEDADRIIKLIEQMKASSTVTSLVAAQEQLSVMEEAERKRITNEHKQEQAEQAARVKQEQKQARADAKQLAVNRAKSGQCPKCGSDNLQGVHSSTQKGFSDTNACGGCCLFGPLGLLCGLCGSGQKEEKTFRMCLNCGNKF